MKVIITRNKESQGVTTGKVQLFDDAGILLLKCVSLELANKNNQRQISCIPKGSYFCKKTYSKKFKNCISVMNVPGRSAILMHVGNFKKDTLGCILLGNQININIHSSEPWISGSRITMNEFLMLVDKNFELIIK